MSSLQDNTVVVKEYRSRVTGKERVLVTLPPVWLRRVGVRNGDTIQFRLAPDSGDLIVRKATKPSRGRLQ